MSSRRMPIRADSSRFEHADIRPVSADLIAAPTIGSSPDASIVSIRSESSSGIQTPLIEEAISTGQVISFVDPGIPNYKQFASEILTAAGADSFGQVATEVIILDGETNGIQQITDFLSERSGVSAIQIFSHGSSGTLAFDSISVGTADLSEYAGQFSTWSQALTDDADILLYGCNVAEGEQGIEFVEALAEVTGADIAASNDVTGSAALNGNWTLETMTGVIETETAMFDYPFALEVIDREAVDDESGCEDINLKDSELPGPIQLDDTKITFVAGWHQPPASWNLSGGEFRNAGSICVRIEYAGKSILLCGDAVGRHLGDPSGVCIATEEFMCDQADTVPIASDVIVAPHHGADNGSSTRFIEAVDPTWVVFSAGHAHQHPTYTAAKRYMDHGVDRDNIFRTDWGDDEDGQYEWWHGRINDATDPPGDDDVDVRIKPNGFVLVKYRHDNSLSFTDPASAPWNKNVPKEILEQERIPAVILNREEYGEDYEDEHAMPPQSGSIASQSSIPPQIGIGSAPTAFIASQSYCIQTRSIRATTWTPMRQHSPLRCRIRRFLCGRLVRGCGR